MKKKSLLLILLMTLLAPWAAKAQETLTVYGDNTTTNEYVPIYGYYADSKSKCEFIIPSEKISAMNGSAISAMKFYLDHSDDGSYYSTISAPFEVFVKEVSATTLSGFVGNSGATTVFNGTITIGLGESGLEIDIPFSSDYIYSGGNLLVGFYQTTTTGYNHTYWTGETQTTNTAWGGYVGSASAKKFLPKTTFTYELVTTPTITLPTSATVKTGFTTELTATLMNVTGTPTITYSSSNNKVASVTGSGTTATVTGVSAGTATITATMVYNATNYYATCDVTVEDPSYCTPSFYNPSDDYIANFATTGGATNIDNTTTYETGGYSNYYEAVSASIEAGETLSCTVTPSSTSYDYGHAIWVDWNKNYEFEASERVAYSTAAAAGNWTGEFEVPSTTAAGDYRLRVLHVYNGTSVTDPCMSGNYGEGEDYKLTVTAASPYQKPVNLQVSALTATTATLTWEAPNSDVLSYKYQYQPDGGTWTELTSTTATSAPLTVLTGNTAYNFQVQAIYAGNNESAFASKSFTTPCAAFPIDYEYGFEDENEFNCWTTKNLVDGYDQIWSNDDLNSAMTTTGIMYSHTGDNSFFFFYIDYPDTNPDYKTIISPELSGTANGLHVEFYYRTSGSYPETFRVGYSTTNNQLSSFTWGTETTSESADYQLFKANYPAGTKYIAVQYTSDDKYFLLLDDFLFEEAASCLEPSDVLVSNITTETAIVTWTNGGEETAWDIYVTDDSTDVPDDTTTPTVANTATKPYPLTGLTPATTHYVYVRAKCSDNSAWSVPAVFNTECIDESLPYSYNFDNPAQFDICWNVINTNTSYNHVNLMDLTTTNKCLAFYYGTYVEATEAAVLPEFDGVYALNEYEITFDACYANTSSTSMTAGKLRVGIMTDPDDITTFTLVKEIDITNGYNTWESFIVRLNSYTGSGHYIAIQNIRTANGYVLVDNIEINHLPACIEPDNLAVSDETAHGATFEWISNGSETEWHLYFSQENTAPADDIPLAKVTVADSNPFTLTTGLDAETNYYAWVRANCGGTDGYSMWVGPETFTTGIACPAPTGFNYSEVTAHTAKLSWDGTSNSYNVWYRTAATMSNPIFSETFETSSLPTGWGRSNTALTDDVLNGTTTINSYSGGWVNTSYGLGQYNWKMNIYSTGKYWLITPSITLDAKNTLNFDAAITAYNSNNAPTSSNMANANSRFVVLITTDNQATWTILREWNNTGSADVLNNISNTGNNFSIDLTAYAGETVKIAFYGGQTASGPDCDLHIDNVVIGTPVEAGEWTKKTADASPYVATGLLAETKYEAKVQGNCGGEGLSQWTASKFFTTDIACPAPTALTASNPTSSSFDIQWTNGGAANWIVAYKKTTETDFTEISLNISDVTEEAGVISYTLGGLDDDTEYTVKVRDNCEPSYTGDGVSDWTAEVTYSTIPACSALNPVVSDITHHNATVNFEGESATGFTVNYRTAEGINGTTESFDGSSAPTGWEVKTGLLSDIMGGSELTASAFPNWVFTTANGVFNNHTKLNIYGNNCKSWLISPEIEVGTGYSLNFDLALTDYNGSTPAIHTGTCDDDRFLVLVFVDDAWEELRKWDNSGSSYVYNNISYAENGENVSIDLSTYKNKTVKIAFYGESTTSGNGDNNLHIDNVTIGVTVPAGDWQTKATATTTADLTGLTAGTKYDLKVVPNCDNTIESNTVQFTTMASDAKYFITEGDWGTASNWLDGEMPTITDNVFLRQNATITGDAAAKKITFDGANELTINDGGQLQTDNTVTATVKKTITGYGAGNEANKANYYLIANPLNSTVYTSSFATVGLTVGNFDLYSWSYSATDNLEWRNYEASTFSLYTKTGYLYAHETDTDLAFTGTVAANNTDQTTNLNYATSGTYDFNGWNLVGNPFTCNAFITLNAGDGNPAMAYYRMNSTGTAIEASTDAIKPMEGIFVKATAASQTVKFSRTAPATDFGNGQLNINVAQVVNSRDAIAETDNAIIRFDGGNTLEKFVFREGRAKLYIPQDETEYAVVASDGQGMMPLNFKVEKTGNYTVSFSGNNVEFSYLHLIDNLTGEDIDLLIEPSYTFMASVRDRENRFIVKFNTIDSNIDSTSDIFAYQNGDEIIVSGEGELQVYDIMGRFVMSSRVNGTERFNASSLSNAVYIFRLVGNEVKTQKIVVK